MLTLVFHQIRDAGKGKAIRHQPMILQWEGSSLGLAGFLLNQIFFLLLCPFLYIFYHTLLLPYTFAFVHGFTVPCYSHTYSLILTLWKIMLFSSLCYHQTQLLVCNPLPAAGWFISLDTLIPAWDHSYHSRQALFYAASCLSTSQGFLVLYFSTLHCCVKDVSILFSMMPCYSYLYKTMVVPHEGKQK